MAEMSIPLTFFILLLCVLPHTLSFGQDKDPASSQDDVDWPQRGGSQEEGLLVRRQTSILLFGALGDLARKYLWRGIFNLFQNRYKSLDNGHQLRVYAAGRTGEMEGIRTLADIMEQTMYCDKKRSDCATTISSFQKISSYHRVKSEDDYRILSESIRKDLVSSGVTENVRIIYLSVPPFAYPQILSFAHEHLMPSASETKLRIVFEKPFGHDRNSSQDLHNLMIKYYREEDIYRVDHYLGKLAVSEILPFRQENNDELQYLWNDEFIRSVEIVMKENIDCKGRTEFYDKYGVVLDVMQNHMTEILVRLVMDLPQDDSFTQFAKLKLKILRNVVPPSEDDTVLGQYADYRKHVADERKLKSNGKINDQTSSVMPTFAAIKMSYKSEHLANTPFYFISGKKLNEKSGYVRVNFKSLYQHKLSVLESVKNCNDFYITFFIHSSDHDGPAIEMSQGLKHLNLKFSSMWEDTGANNKLLLKPKLKLDAYTLLFEKINDGDRSYFVDVESLLESWRIWDPLQQLVRTGMLPVMEYADIRKDDLDFYFDYKTSKLRFVKDQHQKVFHNEGIFSPDQSCKFAMMQESTFLGRKLVTGVNEVVMKRLAVSLVEGINNAERNNNTFHAAFPGGSSVLPLFKKLCQMQNLFRKSHLHIWIVDERCVPLNSSKSNFNLLLGSLQKCINLPYQNLHPLHVGAGSQKCRKEHVAMTVEEMKSWVPSMELDYVILGVGEDGHVASLFPGDLDSHQSLDWVIVNHKGPEDHVPHRISMSFRLINSARTIAIIANGQKKHRIINKLKSPQQSQENFPVMMVKPTNGTLVWYIDNAAYI